MNSKKSNIFRILLSVVALLVILSVGVGVAFAWIEGGDRYSLYTENINLEGPALPSTANNKFTTGTITLNPKKTNSINLDEIYDNITVADSIMFTPMSSDGTNFYLPQAYDEFGTPTYFREATTNDRGTKYIDFDFKVKTTTQCYIAFGADPVITVKKGNSTSSTADTSALRFMITDGTTTKIFSTSDTAITNGKVSQGGNSIAETLTVNPISQYTNSAENKERRLYTYTSTETTTEFRMSIWLDCFGSAASLEALSGSTVEISLNLVVDQEKVNIKFTPITLDCNNIVKDDPDEGGKIDKQSDDLVIGDKFVLPTATENDNFDFIGWYSSNTDFSDTNKVTADTIVDGKITEIFAVFREKPKYTVTVESKAFPSGTGGNVTVNNSGTTYSGYLDSNVKIKAADKEGYTFQGWYTNISCSDSYWLSDDLETTITIGESNATYYAKYVKNYSISLIARLDGNESDTGGEVSFNSFTIGNGSASVQKDVAYLGSVSLYAIPNNNYKLVKIVDSTGNEISTTSPAVVNNITEDKIYYAEFEEIGNFTYYFAVKSEWNSNTVRYNNKWKTGTISNDWAQASMTDTGYRYGGNKVWSVSFPNNDVFYNIGFCIMNGNNQISYLEPYAHSEGWGASELNGKMYVASTNEWIDFDPNNLFTVNVNADNSGTAKVNGFDSVAILSGDSVTLTYTKPDGYNFDGWYDSNGTKYGNTSESQTVQLTGSPGSTLSLTAKFKKAADTRTIYLKPNSNWKQATARFAVYAWDSSGNAWFSMTEVETGIYAAEVPTKYSTLKFVRLAPNTTNDWSNKWNETGDLNVPTNGNNMFTIPSGAWDGSTDSGNWSKK